MAKNSVENKKSLIKIIWENKVSFILYFFITFSFTFGVLYLFDLVPSEFNMVIGRYPEKTNIERNGELPLQIKIPNVGIDVQVYNPESTSTAILDSYLLKGAVRYPGSGLLGGVGNIFIFGHSTGFKVVQNQAFKAFNGLKNLKTGDEIYVYSNNDEYTYRVLFVKMEKSSAVRVDFDVKNRKLTLTTCNTFGAKEDRYIVEAEFLKKKSIK